MNVLEHMERYGYEQLSVYTDTGVGLRAFISIHDTTLGPALGGVRVWPFATEEEALTDVLRLGRAMTYKSAAAGLNFGGGKGLIVADPRRDKSEALMRAFGRFVDTLGGRYITTEDVGMSLQDLEWIAEETTYVSGLPLSRGGSGETSEMTGLGRVQRAEGVRQGGVGQRLAVREDHRIPGVRAYGHLPDQAPAGEGGGGQDSSSPT